jgi:hypothetical protein
VAWLTYDLTRGAAYHGAPATVVDIRPAPEGDEFVVKTLFARTSETQGIRPIALTRVYAAQEDGRWVFGNALLRLTASWDRTQIGPIQYVTPPGRSLDRGRADRLLTFADSVATTFEVPHLQDVQYYVASGPEELHRIMGIEWTFGGIGYGYAMPANNLILSGDPVFGEENRHEVVHLLLARSSAELGTHGLVAEGLATWYGGSAGRSFTELLSEYARFLAERPDVTLDTILGASPPDQGWNIGGAALVQLVYELEGMAAVRALFATGRSNDDLRTGVSSVLGLSWERVLGLWRERIMRAA